MALVLALLLGMVMMAGVRAPRTAVELATTGAKELSTNG